jgi:integrative and conjugative element protein (TIGR02256 family)
VAWHCGASSELRHLFSSMTEKAVPTVVISKGALETIRDEVAKSQPNLETGGILLGRQATDTAALHILVAGNPGDNAVHESRFFLRDREHAQALADAAWHESRAIWIGEWHTHPHGGQSPSHVDIQSYLVHLNDEELSFDEFLSVIVAPAEGHFVIAAWLVTHTELTAAALRESSFQNELDI